MPEILRRLRRTAGLRSMVREFTLSPLDLVYPIFVREGIAVPEPIESMPGVFRIPLSHVAQSVREVEEAGIPAVLIFGVPSEKSEDGSSACDPEGIVPKAIKEAKKAAPKVVVVTDVCICAYTHHGHCGVVCGEHIDQHSTLPILAQIAVAHAKAGADVVAPSSMMDGQVRAIREALDFESCGETAILAYSAKFASAFYGPFREAANSAPSFGDRATYQHDFGNLRHTLLEIQQDQLEGADMLMVKPGIAYLDIVRLARENSELPIVAYSVSGEFSMIKAAAEKGWIDERKIVLETLTAFKRAGANLIITYYAKEAASWLKGY